MSARVPATVLTDPEWLREDLGRAARLYGAASDRVLGTIRWYSASSMLVGPSLESFARTGSALDPALEAVAFTMHPDGRIVDARAGRVLDAPAGDAAAFGTALGDALEPAVEAIAATCGATSRALWAIAADSIGTRLLWAGATGLAGQIADGIGRRMPTPRFVHIGPHEVVRRSSCCLIYEATGGDKCVSCPRQLPAEREQRVRAQLG
ncbi:(2Fe-2S)-binding protein [Prauserella cavernicola]|uniref:(2Fe-2S)-binding protein n=1 Tax=Prauserella cavernicola TaxID=2800127 RepID=A0A934QUM6_9PSEU|nr:(2Fe-2S)-binding protein [Prauserella cavernicola]MBK1786780.1 (2Fe-2S)-binding protein [Prauserella cavernicola]